MSNEYKMTEDEELETEILCHSLRSVLEDLKLTYGRAKHLEVKYDWALSSSEICKAYMTVADVYIHLENILEEIDLVNRLDEGDAK